MDLRTPKKESFGFARGSGFSLSPAVEGGGRKREGYCIKVPGYGQGAGESSNECEMNGRERAARSPPVDTEASEQVQASELYWERLDAVWPSVTTRLRRSPER